jgi:glycosyltransferase involved in cell wall biosynthesis
MNVISLAADGPIGEQMRKNGTRVRCLGMSIERPNPVAVLRLARMLSAERPHIVQTWLQQSDLVGGMAARIAGVNSVLWNIRHSTLHPTFVRPRTRAVSKLCALLSRVLPTQVVCCSQSARDEQIKMGYVARKMTVIMNGISVENFHPDAEARTAIRKELGISERTVLFGTAGRFHAQKDYRNLIKAAGQVLSMHADGVFALCGDGVNENNQELKAWIAASGKKENFRLLGRRADMPQFMAALDICVSASCFGEGFPNVVAEAMSCGVPCVVTDVGDSAFIVGQTGKVVAPERPDLLARACLDILLDGAEKRAWLGKQARTRITGQFSLSRMVESYEQLYMETAAFAGI